MTSKSIRKYAVIMIVGVLLNLGLYWVAHTLHLPMWMDTVGTAFTAVTLEPAAGLIIGYLTNLFEANAVYMSSSIIYYAVTAVAALSFGIALRKNGKISWKRLPLAAVIYFVLASVLATAITIWRNGVPDAGWEFRVYELAVNSGMHQFIACFMGTAALKLTDTIVMCILLPILYKIVPSSFKNDVLEKEVTWKTPFFTKKERLEKYENSNN